MLRKKNIWLWMVGATFLLLYSYTQIDLNLTISSAGIWQSIQKFFQNIGYFNRSFSTYLYCAIVIFLFIQYIHTLRLIAQRKIDVRTFWVSILIISGILFFSYNAFSYDFFNYIFDAKIVTFYQENPYEHKALDYPSDPMLNFMRWTHRVYPYGPIWLLLTIPLSFIGSNIFVLTYFLFKAFIISAYIGTVYYLYKLSIHNAKKDLLIPAFFAYNPLVLIEVLVSGHNDIVMIFFVILSLYLVTQKKKLLALVSFVISIGIKFATIFALPFFLISLKESKRLKSELILYGYVFTMVFAVGAAVARSEGVYQPWYFLFVLPFVALLSYDKKFLYPSILFSLISLLNYVPFLYTGNWDSPIPTILQTLNFYGGISSLIAGLLLSKTVKAKDL